MDVAVLFSGGKDSTFAVYDSLKKGHDVKCLVTILPKNQESYMFHCPNIELAELQARALGIPQIRRKSLGEKEKELLDLEKALEGIRDIQGVVAGGLASKYQADRIEGVCDELGLKLLAPLWGTEPEKYWDILLKSGFRVMVVGVSCQGIGKEWLGRIIDRRALEELTGLSKKFRFHLAGEGGEFETLVLDCPIFRKRLKILKARKVWEGDSGSYLVEKAELTGK